MIKVIGVRFRAAGKIYFFDPGKLRIQKGDNVIVETARGVEFGTVVGDMKEVEEALPILEIRFDDAEIKLHYQNPKLKVKIGKDGTIEKGTWEYQIYITVANLYVGGRRLPLSATVESAYGVVDYKITVGGGF